MKDQNQSLCKRLVTKKMITKQKTWLWFFVSHLMIKQHNNYIYFSDKRYGNYNKIKSNIYLYLSNKLQALLKMV